MSEIKAGEYVRTKKGQLDKVINNNYYMPAYVECKKKGIIFRENIKNHKEKLIELLEEGDYVNGEYVIQVSKELNCVFIETTYYDELAQEEKHNFIKAEEIESIVTHEQFKNIEYKVGE